MKIYKESVVKAGDGFRWVREEIDYDVETDFSIDEDDIDGELCRIGRLLFMYGDLAAELEVELARKNDNLELVHSHIVARLRESAEGKKTETQLKQEAVRDDNYIRALEDLRITQISALKAKNWFKAIQKKADAAISLAYKKRDEVKRYGV